jgi:16S rRNA (guanine966-N2)-methyltransferase
MRVIAGQFRSRPLLAPAGMDTRPTADRLRETLFNVLTNGVEDRIAAHVFLDLYAGSGAVGIEALSRGAERVVFVESSPAALAVLGKNIENLKLRAGYAIERRSTATFLRREAAKPQPGKYDVVFLDPPYEAADEYALTLGLLGGECASLLTDKALIIAEHRRKNPLAESFGKLVRTRVLEQGDAGLSFYAIGSEI